MLAKKSFFFNILITLFLLFTSTIFSFAQEKLIGLSSNPQLLNHKLNTDTNKKKSLVTVELPFFDDFSTSNLYPNTDLWADSFAFINSSYPYQPPTVGVATLDAINKKGEFYSGSAYGKVFIADYLSSQLINLNYPGDNTIYLSFYYQAQGKGDNPEVQDSLALDFYAPDEDTWTTVWEIEGQNISDFKQVIIHVNDAKYLKPNFRFRFRNKASLSNSTNASKIGNVDHWHIDYVYLNSGRSASDLIHHDVAFTEPMSTFLNDYEQMPWKHYLINPANEINTNLSVYYRNNDNVTRTIDSLYFVFYDEMTTQDNDTLFAGAYNIFADELKNFYAPPNYIFSSTRKDSARFRIKSRMVTDGFDETVNNEIAFYQKFYNYYSYDDGTAEMGYGITGEGTTSARLAYRFNVRKKDTLRAVDMYFNRTLNDASQKYFYLTVWKDDGTGKPGEEIYKKENYRPEYDEELNKFQRYHIRDTILEVEGNIYVGWTQTTSDMLNVGFDINRIHNENIFYNISGIWNSSFFAGSLMIRPVFGAELSTGVENISKNNVDVLVYPNPMKENIYVNIKNQKNTEKNSIYIYNLTGKLVHKSILKNNSSVNIKHIKEGIYLLKIFNKKKQLVVTKKLIKL